MSEHSYSPQRRGFYRWRMRRRREKARLERRCTQCLKRPASEAWRLCDHCHEVNCVRQRRQREQDSQDGRRRLLLERHEMALIFFMRRCSGADLRKLIGAKPA